MTNTLAEGVTPEQAADGFTVTFKDNSDGDKVITCTVTKAEVNDKKVKLTLSIPNSLALAANDKVTVKFENKNKIVDKLNTDLVVPSHDTFEEKTVS